MTPKVKPRNRYAAGTSSTFMGSFEFVVKTAFLDWEAAVLPLNYARKPLSIFRNANPLT
jgi:hypothetical protein